MGQYTEAVKAKLALNLAKSMGFDAVPMGTVMIDGIGEVDFDAFLNALLELVLGVLTGCLKPIPTNPEEDREVVVANRWKNPGPLEIFTIGRAVRRDKMISKDKRGVAKTATIKTAGECAEEEIRGSLKEINGYVADWSLF